MKNPKSSWKTISSRVAYKNPWIRVREDKVIGLDGKRGVYGVVETNGPSVFIVTLSEDKHTHLVLIDRYPTKQKSWEIPGGGSDGQNTLTAAKRELFEETGLEAKKWKLVGTSQVMNGVCNEQMITYLAQDLKQRTRLPKKNADLDILELKRVLFKKVLQMVKEGVVTDSQSITAITLAALHLGYLKL